jgi:predicted ABC-type ATPase
MKHLYVIAGCNGAGKTTASYTILPEMLACKEFVNADEIARGLSPFQPEKAAIQGGKLMLSRIKSLLKSGETFAFETTLSTRSYLNLIKTAKEKNYEITLLFFWLHSTDLAISRVKTRVREGGHSIHENVIKRRYQRGLTNFFNLFKPIIDNWIFIDNSGDTYEIIAEGSNSNTEIANNNLWEQLKIMYEKG